MGDNFLVDYDPFYKWLVTCWGFPKIALLKNLCLTPIQAKDAETKKKIHRLCLKVLKLNLKYLKTL